MALRRQCTSSWQSGLSYTQHLADMTICLSAVDQPRFSEDTENHVSLDDGKKQGLVHISAYFVRSSLEPPHLRHTKPRCSFSKCYRALHVIVLDLDWLCTTNIYVKWCAAIFTREDLVQQPCCPEERLRVDKSTRSL